MLQIEDKVISLDLLEEKFSCNLENCKGACCVVGDAGAPLEEEETKLIEEIFPRLVPFLSARAVDSVKKQGVYVIDSDGDKVTPLLDDKECVYAIFENGIARCAIEKAYNEGVISFQKPVSCHLYPLRIKKYRDFFALNYERWHFCDSAVKKGKTLGLPLYRFCQSPLERKFGKEFYQKLGHAAEHLKKQGR